MQRKQYSEATALDKLENNSNVRATIERTLRSKYFVTVTTAAS